MPILINEIFWWIGASICALGAVLASLGSFILIGYLCYHLVVMYKIAQLVECHPYKTIDCAAYRFLYRFKHTVGFLFRGVPTEMTTKNGVIFHSDWIKEGKL
jgi:hypothetical protein